MMQGVLSLCVGVTLWIVTTTGLAQQPAHTAKPVDTDIPIDWQAFRQSANPIDRKTVAEVERTNWTAICAAWGRETRSNKNPRRAAGLREYLLYKDLINGIDLQNFREMQLDMGMTACGVIAARGMPSSIKVSTTPTSQGIGMVYRKSSVSLYLEAKSDSGQPVVKGINSWGGGDDD